MRRYSGPLVFVLGLALLFSVQPAYSQASEDFKALKKEVEGLRKDVQDLRRLAGLKPTLAPAPEIKDAIINIKGAPIKGDKNAKLVWVEFSDYQ